MNRYESLFESPIGRDLLRNVDDPHAVFIFPSQDSADSWAYALIKSGFKSALALNRFFGFENFLRFCIEHAREGARRAVTPIDRWLWALEALDGASMEQPTLAQLSRLVGLVSSRVCEEDFVAAQRALSAQPYAFIHEEYAEFSRLFDHYRAFLDANGIVDGHREKLEIPQGINPRAYGLKEDFRALGLCSVEFPSTDVRPKYHEFDSFLSELEWVFSAISEKIAQGKEPEDIVLSVCRMNGQNAAWIRHAAAEHNISISIRWGETLLSAPFGRFLSAIRSASSEGLTLEAIDSFAAFSSIRARDPQGWKNLRESALRAHMPATSPHASYLHRLWTEATQPGYPAQISAQFYTRLWKDITELSTAPTFSELSVATLSFLEHWVDTTEFSKNAYTDRSMRMALDELQQWTMHEDRVKRGSFSPFELYMAALQSKDYIPQFEEGSVPIYDMRTTSGMAALSHYVVGASLRGMAPLLDPGSSLPGMLKSIVEPNAREDPGRILALYQNSPTVFSFARAGLEDYEVACPQFGTPEPQPFRSKPSSIMKNKLKETRQSTTTGIGTHTAARMLEATKSFDFERHFAIFSPHSLKERAQCGFRWCAHKFELEDVYAVDDEALIVGDFLHKAYQRAILSLPTDISHFDELELSERLNDALDRSLRTTASESIKKQGPGIRPMLSALMDKARHRLSKLWEFERHAFANYPERIFEQQFTQTFDEEGAFLNGRIDCVLSRSDESVGKPCRVVVDYKKNTVPQLSDMRPAAPDTPPEEEDSENADSESAALALKDIQIPLYALALEMQGSAVEGALYWSIEKAKAMAYIAPPASQSFGPLLRATYATEAESAPSRAALRGMLADAASRIAHGQFLDRTADRAHCGDCGYAPLCRYWYFLEL